MLFSEIEPDTKDPGIATDHPKSKKGNIPFFLLVFAILKLRWT
jgi:hypothetical protein